jgi:hypothetical protein
MNVCSSYFAEVSEQCVGRRSALKMAVTVLRQILTAFNGPIGG